MKYYVILFLGLFFIDCMSIERSSVDNHSQNSKPLVKNQQIEEIIQKSKIQPVSSVSRYQATGMASYFHLLAEEQVVQGHFDYASSLYELAFKFDQDPYYSLRHIETLSLGKKQNEAKSQLKRYRLMFPADKDLQEIEKRNFGTNLKKISG